MGVSSPNPRLGSLTWKYTVQNAYLCPGFEDRRPLFSTKTDDFQGWIDHIFVSKGIKLHQVLSPPIYVGDLDAGSKARQFLPIPNDKFPSDHIPLGVVVRV
jgi:mRNA deadenylase 3'-5' endonuclease subunit Ccr4